MSQLDDGIFDDNDDIFDSDDGDEGIFNDKESIFDTPTSPKVDHHNPLTTKQEEQQQYETPHKPALREGANSPPRAITSSTGVTRIASPSDRQQLVAKFDAAGRPAVARAVNGKLIEPFRHPTKAEFDKLRTQGRIVKGGVTPAASVGEAPAAGASSTKKMLLWGGVLAVAAGAGWWWWKRYRADTDASTQEAEG
jgi:hypothetical protein